MPDSWLMIGAVALGAALAGFVQGLSGFAFSLVAMGLWAWALPPQIAAPLAVFGALLGQVASLASVRGGFDFRRIAPLVVGGALGVPVGVFLLHNADPAALQARDRGAADALRPLRSGGVAIRRASRRAGAASTRSPACRRRARRPGRHVGDRAGDLDAIARLEARSQARDDAGLQHRHARADAQPPTRARERSTQAAFRLFALVAPAMLIPSYFGARLYHRFSEKTFERLVLALLLASGLALLVGGARTLWGRAVAVARARAGRQDDAGNEMPRPPP